VECTHAGCPHAMSNRSYHRCLSFFSMAVCEKARERGKTCRIRECYKQWESRQPASRMEASSNGKGGREYTLKRKDMCCNRCFSASYIFLSLLLVNELVEYAGECG